LPVSPATGPGVSRPSKVPPSVCSGGGTLPVAGPSLSAVCKTSGGQSRGARSAGPFRRSWRRPGWNAAASRLSWSDRGVSPHCDVALPRSRLSGRATTRTTPRDR
jgi:hypothetical protein